MVITLFNHKVEIKKNAVYTFVITCIHMIISIFNDICIFDTSNNYHVFKILFFLILLVIWHNVINLAVKLKSKDKDAITFVKIFIPYLILNIILLVLVWPGNWLGDDIPVYNFAECLTCKYWQHYLTALLNIFALMLMPYPMGAAGVSLVQVIIISIIVASVITTVQKNLNTKYLHYILYIPFLLPTAFFLNTHVLRLVLYAYIDLLFIVKIIDAYKNRILTKGRLALLIFLTVILSVWRTECIYYIILAPVLFLFLFKNIADKRQKNIYVVSVVFFSLILNLHQSLNSENYSLTAFVNPLVPLTQRAYEENDTEFLGKVDKVYDVEKFLDGAEKGMTGEQIFWIYTPIQPYTDEDYSEFQKAYLGACIKYYDTFLKERFYSFFHTTDSRYSEIERDSNTDEVIDFFARNKTLPLTENIRLKLLYVLSDEFKPVEIFWQPCIPIFFMLLTAIYLLFAKKYACSSVLFLSGIKVVLTFLTAPGYYFMYYFPTYLCGYFCLFFAVVYLCCKFGKKKAAA